MTPYRERTVNRILRAVILDARGLNPDRAAITT